MLRHAGAVPVTVAVTGTADALDVVVTDAGPGGRGSDSWDSWDGSDGWEGSDGSRSGAGRGLAGMRQRCELLGGSLAAGPAAGGGFQVRAHLPVPAQVGTGS